MSDLYSAICYMAGRCDGASTKDNVGFNGYDAGYGKRLSYMPESEWTEKDKYNAWKMLKKYRGQLLAGGIDYSQIPEQSNGFARSEKLIGVLASGEFVVMFPYNPALVAEVKALPQRRFDGDGKRWVVAPVAANIPALWTFIQAHPEFEVTQTALDKMAEIDAASEPAPAQPEQPKFDGVLSLDDKKVVVTFNAIPDQTTRDWMKKIPGWKFEGATKQWSFPAGAALAIAQKFSNHDGAAIILEDASRDADNAVKEVDQTKGKLHAAIDVNAPLPNGRTLYGHQKEGVNFMLNTHKLILGDDMGLGKTLQALLVAKAWKQAFDYPAFVICPAGLKDNWLKEVAMVQTPIEVYSWAKMPQVPDRPFVLICDEAHYAQNAKSARGKNFLALSTSENCKALIAATGTPMKNGRPVNMWPLLRAVGADFAMDKKGYERRYCAAGPTRFSQWNTSGAAHLDELHEKCKPFMLRRLKKDCLDLPGKVRTMRAAELSGEAQEIYDSAFNAMREDYLNRLKIADENKKVITARYLAAEIDADEYRELLDKELSSEGEQLVMLTHLRRAMSIAKVETALEVAGDVLEEGRSIVIFTDFVESAQQIAKALQSYGVELLTGDVTGKDAEAGVSKRQAMVDRFQAGKSRVFVSTIKAGGVGITLTAASDVILVDRPWTPGDAEQAEDRCNRIGQSIMVNCQWIQAGDIDVKVDEILIQKQERIDAVMEGKRKTMRATGGSITGKAMGMLFEMFDNKQSMGKK